MCEGRKKVKSKKKKRGSEREGSKCESSGHGRF
jgi:hypothetical protein